MKTRYSLRSPMLATLIATLALAGGLGRSARADFLINNGGFEAGFASWSRSDQIGSEGTFVIQTGTKSPLNLDPVPAPPGGTNAAMTDAFGPGSHVLYQDFLVPTYTITAAILKFDLFIGNRATAFATPASGTLDFATTALNQQARVDVLNSGTDPFSVAAADVLQNVYQTKTTDALVSGYNTTTVDLTALLNANRGKVLRLRFAEADNIFSFQLGVDNVSLSAVPEPSSLASLTIGVALTAWGFTRARQPRTA
ncbi:MAG: PEP-CTERM sorting domain-containing protein [Isosphaeraceae bacterium]